MGLTATGIGSGLEISNIVKALVDAEKLPKQALFNQSENNLDAKVSALAKIKSRLASFKDTLNPLTKADSLAGLNITLEDSANFSAKITGTAQAASYALQVDQLAAHHKIAGTHTASATDTVGQGSLNFTVNGDSFNVAVAATDSLYDIADNINQTADNNHVSASVLSTDAGSRLILNSLSSGTNNQIGLTVTDPLSSGLDAMFGSANISTISAAKNAIIQIDGQQLTAQQNQIDNAIAGVSLALTKADASQSQTLTIESDPELITEKVTSFVDGYNELMSELTSFFAYDPESKGSKPFDGDAMLRMMIDQFRRQASELVTNANGTNVALYDLGISIDTSANMQLNETELTALVEQAPEKIQDFFADGSNGVANKMTDIIESYLSSGGLMDSRDTSLTYEKKRLTERQDRFDDRIASLEARLLMQFNAMDQAIARINQQSSGLINNLYSLPGVFRRS